VCGVLFGFGLTLTRPFPALVWAVLGFLAIAVAAGVLYLPPHRLWFPWLLMAAIQIPCAWLCAVAVHTQNLYREKAALERRLTERASTPPAVQAATPGIEPTEDACEASSPTRTMEQAHTLAIPAIADHKLLRQVGKGAYGEVWLAQNAIGLFHAVKIVYRRHFKEAAPYEREFKGIQKYMPISLNHPSLTHVLHVGRNDQAGHFYYIMEVGDDQNTGTSINPQVYSPRNFAKDLEKRGRLTVPECVELFLELTAALQYLHGQELIHRDIKPSNIIFVKGQPKFADIGLVTEIRAPGRDTTFIGTEGYMAPEGPGAPAADLYGLGKVLYVAATGLDRRRFPEWPERLPDRPPQKEWAELRAIILKACESDPKRRYQSAAEIRRDLEQLRQQIKSG
jgi:serine/threonine protein kinase